MTRFCKGARSSPEGCPLHLANFPLESGRCGEGLELVELAAEGIYY